MTIINGLQTQSGESLVLSGGATKAFYFHLGVLKVLDLQSVTSIVGSSAGAVLGTFIASGASIEQVIDMMQQDEVYLPEMDTWVKTLTSSMLFRPRLKSLFRQGLHTGFQSLRSLTALPQAIHRDVLADIIDSIVTSQNQASSFFTAELLEEMLMGLLPQQNFDGLEKDLYVIATDLDSGRRAIFNASVDDIDDDNRLITGATLPQAIRASAAVPGLFEPVKIKGRYYVDGEIKRTLSADIGLQLADTVIVSHTYQPLERANYRTINDLGWWSILKQSAYIVFSERIKIWEQLYQDKYPNKKIILIAPDPDDEAFFLAPQFSFRKEVQNQLIESGERAAYHALERYNLTPDAL